MPIPRSRLLVAVCVLAAAGCAGPRSRLGVSAVAPNAPAIAPVVTAAQGGGPVAPAPFALQGVVMGPAAGVIANNAAGLLSNNAAGLLSNNAAGLLSNNAAGIVSSGSASYRLQAASASASLAPLAGARVTLVDAQGKALTDEAVVTGADGHYRFKRVPDLAAIAFVRAEREVEGQTLALLAPARLVAGRTVDASPATTVVAKSLMTSVAKGATDLAEVDDSALAAIAEVLAPVMSEQAIALALLIQPEKASQMIAAMAKASPALASALAAAPAPGGGFEPAAVPTKVRHSGTRTTISTLYGGAPFVGTPFHDAPVELGVKFRAKVDGQVTALRFFKDASDAGPHVANLWTLDGRLLATATFSGESASGWQEVAFPTPVAIDANAVYIASCYSASGVYVAASHAFTGAGVDGAILQAPDAAVVEGNGVFASGSASAFPGNNSPTDDAYGVDVVFASPQEAPATTATSLFGNAAPDSGPHMDGSANELGVKFRSDVAGAVTGLRFYKGAGNDGTHVGSLWAADGTRLASATFTSETASGWQSVTFPYPVAIAPGTTYVASYYAPLGHYQADQYYFAGLEHRNGPLVALADGVDGANSVYCLGGMTFPTLMNGHQSNYWVDATFSTTAPAAPASVSFWNQAAGPVGDQVDPGDPADYELGMIFSPQVAGRVTGARFYKGAANTGPHEATLWDGAGTALATATFTGETASGWQTVSFDPPVDVAAHASYVVSYSCPNGHVSATHGYFDTPMANPYMRVPVAGGVYSATPGQFPDQVSSNNNYWIEPLFTETL